MIDKLTANELKSLITALYDTYQIDFGNYALTLFRRRVSNFLAISRFNHLSDFIHKITTDLYFFESFIKQVSVDETELFRDPTMWHELRTDILPKLIASGKLRVWVVDCTTGDELLSLLIVLKELNFIDKAEVIVTNINKVLNENAMAGSFDSRKVEIGIANYKRYRDDSDLNRYFSLNNKNAYFDYNLLRNVRFEQYLPGQNKAPQAIDLVLFRNKMIAYNRNFQNDFLNEIYFSLKNEGVLIVGIKETLANTLIENQFRLHNVVERIYIKT